MSGSTHGEDRTAADATLDDVREHLRSQYDQVFTDEAIERHLQERVGMEAADESFEILRARRPDAIRILDVGCGYGSFVLVARNAGLDAVGLEPTTFELEWARKRLAESRPADDPAAIYVAGDARTLPFADCSFDAVTLWNVLEHVPDEQRALREAGRVLRPGGSLFLLAPNYASFRREAHYHVPWLPLLPKPAASLYLRALGRDPSFFMESVYPCTKLGTMRMLRSSGLALREPRLEKLSNLSLIERSAVRRRLRVLQRLHLLGLVRLARRVQLMNPLASGIFLEAIKPSRSKGLSSPGLAPTA